MDKIPLKEIAESLLTKSQVLSTVTKPDRAQSLLVATVSESSPASLAGICQGDLLVKVDDIPAASQAVVAGSTLEFYRTTTTQGFRIQCKSQDIGADLLPTAELVKSRFQVNTPDLLDLLALWQLGEWKLLENLVSKSILSLNGASFFERFRKKLKPLNNPLTALYGSVLYEKGTQSEGLRWLDFYRARANFTDDPCFVGLCDHYQAVDDQDVGALHACFHKFAFEATGRELEMREQSPENVAYCLRGFLKRIDKSLEGEDHESPTLLLMARSEEVHQEFCALVEGNQALLRSAGIRLVTLSEEAWSKAEIALEGLNHRHLSIPLGTLAAHPQLVDEVLLLSPRSEVLGRVGPSMSLWAALQKGSHSSSPGNLKPYERALLLCQEKEASKRRGFRSGIQEKICYLLPCREFSESELEAKPNALVKGWELAWGEAEKAQDGTLTLQILDCETASEWLGEDVFEHFERAMLTAGDAEIQTLRSFCLVQGHGPSKDNFGLHQAALMVCQFLCKLGGLGAWDHFAQRWISREALGDIESDFFDIKDHVGIEIRDGLCQTRGLREKFGAAEYSMRLVEPHLVGAVVYLLNEIAEQVAHGKSYGDRDLFRWRSGVQVCQLLFRSLNPDADEANFEAVDMLLENKIIRTSTNASACLRYFVEAAPHWNLGYGWPPKPRPKIDIGAASLSILGVIPGMKSEEQALQDLGPAMKTENSNVDRWVFSHHSWDSPIRLEIAIEDGVVSRVESNSLQVQGCEISDRNSLSFTEELLGKLDLSRTFSALPDRNLVRQECLWVRPHPLSPQDSLLCVCLFDHEFKLWRTSLSLIKMSPAEVLVDLKDSYGRDFLTGHTNQRPAPKASLSKEAQVLKVWLEYSMNLIPTLSLQFGKKAWLGQELQGLSLVVGGYLKGRKVPKAELLDEIGLPAELFLDFFEELDLFLNQLSTKEITQRLVEGKKLDSVVVGSFLWLLEQSQCRSEEKHLAVDFAQVFQMYETHLSQLSE